jgi:hypothetical protein
MSANDASLSDEGMILRGVVDVRKQKRRCCFDAPWMIWWGRGAFVFDLTIKRVAIHRVLIVSQS